MNALMNQQNLIRLRLLARAWSRMCGGYGILGHWIGLTRGAFLGAVIWTLLVAFPKFFEIKPENECQRLDCLLTQSDIQTLANYTVILTFVLFITEIFIKPWARSMPITDDLRDIATSGVPEAAFALFELYAEQGAEAQKRMWLRKASELGHHKAVKISKLQEKQ
jgi:hypothetical protein